MHITTIFAHNFKVGRLASTYVFMVPELVDLIIDKDLRFAVCDFYYCGLRAFRTSTERLSRPGRTRPKTIALAGSQLKTIDIDMVSERQR
jgi:hypothetical protein